jgi:hypothetical protein
MQARIILSIIAVVASVTFAMIATIYPIENQASAQQQDQPIPFTVQNTSMSTQDHYLVMKRIKL